MTVTHALFVIVLCAFAGSFTWGMRGTILGGERGAMLPGAALALVLLYAGGDIPLTAAYPLAAVAGAAGMFFGGSQTYGETIGLTRDSDAAVRRYARFGLAVKGAGWFGAFGGLFSFAVSAWSGRFTLWQVILFTALLPVVKWLGVLVFNYPQKAAEDRFPKIYFSESRFEVWGGLLFICIYVCIFGCIVREWLMPLMTAFGIVFGALGFWIGNLFQTALDGGRDKGLFAFLRRLGAFSAWKGMECIFGAVGGLGLGLGWCLLYRPLMRRYVDRILIHSGVWNAFGEKTDNILLFVWLSLFVLFVLRYMLRQDANAFAKAVHRCEDILIYPVFCYLPLFLASCGNMAFAEVFSVSVMLYLLSEKIVFAGAGRYQSMKGAKILQGVLIGCTAVMFLLQLIFDVSFSAYLTLLMYVVSYLVVYAVPLVVDLICSAEGGKKFVSSIGWTAWAFVCALVLLIPGWFYFSEV